jgi:hypothetical protein
MLGRQALYSVTCPVRDTFRAGRSAPLSELLSRAFRLFLLPRRIGTSLSPSLAGSSASDLSNYVKIVVLLLGPDRCKKMIRLAIPSALYTKQTSICLCARFLPHTRATLLANCSMVPLLWWLSRLWYFAVLSWPYSDIVCLESYHVREI